MTCLEVSPECTSGPSGHMVDTGIPEHETPIYKRLRSFKRMKYVSPECTSGPSGHLAATNRFLDVSSNLDDHLSVLESIPRLNPKGIGNLPIPRGR